jgi:hypothetical protein
MTGHNLVANSTSSGASPEITAGMVTVDVAVQGIYPLLKVLRLENTEHERLLDTFEAYFAPWLLVSHHAYFIRVI